MKRPLTDEEKKMCKKGIKNRKEKITELKEELEYFTAYMAFQKKWKSYLDNKEKKEKERKQKIMEQTLSQLKTELKGERKALEIEKDQLKNGVTVKEIPSGIN